MIDTPLKNPQLITPSTSLELHGPGDVTSALGQLAIEAEQ